MKALCRLPSCRLFLAATSALAFASVVFPPTAHGDPSTYSTGVKRVIFESHDEWAAAKPLGDGFQQKTGMAQCRDKPDIIYLTQDVAAPSVSLDGGVSWYLPHWVGMKSHLTQGVMCDPIDPRRVAVVTNEVYLGQTGEAGLYVSFDGGQTATRKVTDVGNSSGHSASQGIGFNPASESGGKANRWIFVGADDSGNFPVYESSDGMDNFSHRTDYSSATYGLVKHVIGHPTDDNRYLVAFNTGLYWLNNAHTGTIALQKITGTGGLPAGGVNGPPYISPDAQTVIVGVAGAGVYKSTDGGANWSIVGSSHTDLHKLFVNWMNTNYMAISRNTTGSGGAPLFSSNGGTTFAAPTSIEKRPGFTGSLSTGYQHNHVAWINGSGELWYAGRQTSFGGSNSDFRSTDGGVNLTLSMKGMNGVHLGGLLDGRQVFDPADKNRIGIPAIDTGWWITTDGLKSVVDNRVPSGVNVGTHSTVHGAILHPTLNRAVVGMETGTSGYLYVYNNGTWTHPSVGVKDAYEGLCYNDDTLVAFGGALKSTDWLTWTSMPNLGADYRIVGCTHTATGGQAIFAVDTKASSNPSRNVKRSLDDGATWTVVLTTSYRLMGDDGFPLGPFLAHPGNKDIIFTKDSTSPNIIRQWDLTSGSGASTRTWTSLDPTNGASVDFKFTQLAIDPRDNTILYARNASHGSGYKLMRSTSSGASGTWTNLSTLVPDGRGQFMAVHPLTGELLFTTSSGMWLIEPPYAQSGKLGDGMLTAGNMLQDDYLDTGIFNANEDIGAPSLLGSASYDDSTGSYTVTGSGADIYGTADQFRFLHQDWTGDGRMIARVASQTTPATNNWAKAGLMFRNDASSGSPNVDLIIAPNPTVSGSIQLLQRATASGTTTQVDRIDGTVMPYWLRLERHGNQFTGWHSIDGLVWLANGSTTLTLNSSGLAGLSVTAHDNTKLNTAVFDNVSLDTPPTWLQADIGSVGSAGSTTIDYATDIYTVNGAGANIYTSADSFQFCYLPWTGDVTIIAEVTSVENTNQNAKGGLMIRQSLTNNSQHAVIDLKPELGAVPGVEFMRRTTSGGTGGHSSGSPVAGISAPRFLKLVRTGNTFKGYQSPDSVTWTQVGSTETITMTGTVYVGLVACSIINTTNLCTATFESVFVR